MTYSSPSSPSAFRRSRCEMLFSLRSEGHTAKAGDSGQNVSTWLGAHLASARCDACVETIPNQGFYSYYRSLTVAAVDDRRYSSNRRNENKILVTGAIRS